MQQHKQARFLLTTLLRCAGNKVCRKPSRYEDAPAVYSGASTQVPPQKDALPGQSKRSQLNAPLRTYLLDEPFSPDNIDGSVQGVLQGQC